VFDAFYTSNRPVADGRRGIGLGLPLCRTIVEAHGGALGVRDGDPCGAVFWFSIPLEEVPDRG
jgi:two-component system sensor histidine kinase KdpD